MLKLSNTCIPEHVNTIIHRIYMIILTLPIIAALTGWITNFIAIKMLFHPREKVKILFLEIQGIFPKRQKKLAEKLGKVVSDELFSMEDVRSAITNPDNLGEVHQVIDEKLDDFLENRMMESMPMLYVFMSDEMRVKIKATLQQELELMLPELIGQFANKIEKEVDVERTVYEKVVNFSSDKLEEILYSIMQKEFKFIEILGGVLGFIIGLIQIGLLQLQ